MHWRGELVMAAALLAVLVVFFVVFAVLYGQACSKCGWTPEHELAAPGPVRLRAWTGGAPALAGRDVLLREGPIEGPDEWAVDDAGALRVGGRGLVFRDGRAQAEEGAGAVRVWQTREHGVQLAHGQGRARRFVFAFGATLCLAAAPAPVGHWRLERPLERPLEQPLVTSAR